MQKTEIGNKAELQACKFLISQNVKIIEQNFKALPYGEIDIIALGNCHTREGGYLFDNTHKPKDPRVKHEDDGTYFKARTGMTASDDKTLIFIEVKYRKSANFGTAQEMVSKSKQQKIINTANIFLEQNPQYQNYECRFDVIAINNNDIEWIKSAFNAF